ncbi:hypothetical protein GCM10023321_59770 [Pseudonocardia eucalypti]|uniref:Uncharacterized protein n=1 Tax=Pseudonocardia eucalypti TaxID=648755 RepID=A0ABP9QTF9_9PSEU
MPAFPQLPHNPPAHAAHPAARTGHQYRLIHEIDYLTLSLYSQPSRPCPYSSRESGIQVRRVGDSGTASRGFGYADVP